jgi:hypothetical protein
MKSTLGIWAVRSLAALSLLTIAGCYSGWRGNDAYNSSSRSNWNHSDQQSEDWKVNRDSGDRAGAVADRNPEYSADYSDRYYRDVN